MSGKKGIWIDSKKAIIVSLDEGERKLKTINSDIDGKEREEGESKKFGRFASQFLSFEKKNQRKRQDLEKNYLSDVIKSLGNPDEFVIFGPAGMKKNLEKEIDSRNDLKSALKGVEDADSMTDNQVGAWVEDYFKR